MQEVFKEQTSETVDPAFQKTSKFLTKFVKVMDNVLDKNDDLTSTFSLDPNNFEYTKLVSKKKSGFQPMHADFATFGE